MFGWFAFRSRITGVYLSIITQAMTFALMLAFFRNDMGFGGNNGLTDFKDILGFPLNLQSTRIGLYVASQIALILSYLLCRRIVASKLGRVLIAIRDAEPRVRFLGYSVTHYKLFVFTVSAMLAGVAGALYVPQVGIINPSEFSPAASIEAVIWVAVGGRGTLFGAVVGAFVVNGAKTLSDLQRAGVVAVRPRRPVHRRDPVPAARPGRAPSRHSTSSCRRWARSRPAAPALSREVRR